MSILITGAGTIGCQVARSAIEKDVEKVIVYELNPDKEFIESIAGNKVIIEQGSILDLSRLFEVIKKYEVIRIIHTATLPGWCPHIYDIIQVVITGTAHIFEAARFANIKRVIHCSTAQVYDFVTQRPKAPVDETYPVKFQKNLTYVSAKYATEGIALNYAHKFDLDIISFRIPLTVGPSIDYNMTGKLWIYDILKQVHNNHRIRFDYIETRRLCWTYAKDVADNLVKAAYFNGEVNSPLYNCSYPDLNSLQEMIEALKQLIPDLHVEIGEMKEVGWKYPYDSSKAIEELGFEFRYDPKEMFADYLKWMDSNQKYIV